ncbi:MAG: hypothetical protein WA790_08260 [Sulfitobacter sp.]
MPRRIILHAGFHKTGTKTLQRMLRSHRDLLSPTITVVLVEDMKQLCAATRQLCSADDPLDFSQVTQEATRLAQTWLDFEGTILISGEDLAGMIPGRKGAPDYSASPQILRAITDAFSAVLPDAALGIFFTTRAAAPWLNSCYAQHLQSVRMKLSVTEYAQAFASSADLNAAVDAVARALPNVDVHRIALEACADRRLGTLDALLDIAKCPSTIRNAIQQSPPSNVSPQPKVLADLLEINRSDMCDGDAEFARGLQRKAAR